MGDIAIAETGGFDDETEDAGTGTYVVVGIYDNEDTFDLTPAYGPFDDLDAASKYGTTNYQFSWVCEIVNTEGCVQASIIDPNQTSISDYIDPSVVE